MKIDSRIVYLVVGVVGLLAVLVVAILVGQYSSDKTVAATNVGTGEVLIDPNIPPPVGTPRGNLRMEGIPTSEFNGEPIIKQVFKGIPPVSLEDVPVARGEPRLWIEGLEESDWITDFGEIPADGPTERDFVVRNIGRGDLIIDEIGGSCGCTGVSIGEKVLAPGATTIIRVSYDPRVSKDFGKEVKKQVYIKSNDPQARIAEFHFTAKVQEQDGGQDGGDEGDEAVGAEGAPGEEGAPSGANEDTGNGSNG